MSSAPSVLLLDDGELDRVHTLLKRIGADYVRLQKGQVGFVVDEPRDLLISSGRYTMQMPRVEARGPHSSNPTWLCIHNQDFLPLRDRLRELGVHFLVQNALDQESLRLLILQLLYRGPERRRSRRLPLGGPISFRVGADTEPAKLAELSVGMCRFVSTRALPIGTSVRVVLPKALGGGEELGLEGRVVRSAECELRTGQSATSTVVAFDDLASEARAQLEKLVRGEHIGTRVTPLAGDAGHVAVRSDALDFSLPPEDPSDDDDERRQHTRHEYGREVQLLDFGDAVSGNPALGQDLSIEGIRLAGVPGLAPETRVTLALYGGQREEPVVITAEVLRQIEGAGGEAALRFVDVTPDQERQVERLLGGTRQIESLQSDTPGPNPVVVAQVQVMEAQSL